MLRTRSSFFAAAIVFASLSAASMTLSIDLSTASAEPGFTLADVERIRADADRAMSEGRYQSARALYETVIVLVPNDARALREAGRTAHAMQDFAAAAELLARAALENPAADPELHYLLGEALWTLDRKPEARVAHQRALAELAGQPLARMQKLWIARIHGRLGDRAAADAIYDALASANPVDAEAALAQAEMHAVVQEWPLAERAIRRFLAVRPRHRRGLEMLAWILEARGLLGSELSLRELLAHGASKPEPVRDYGRALERSGDWAGALAAYRKASRLPGGSIDGSLTRALARMDRRMSIEIAAGALAKSDPSADSYGGFTGVALPFGRANHVALGAWHEFVSKDGREGSGGELWGALSLRGRTSHAIAGAKLGIIDFTGAEPAPGVVRESRARTFPGAFGSVGATLAGGHLQLGVDAELASVWRETPRAVMEGGSVDATTAHLWAVFAGNRLVIDTGTQLRRLRLEESAAGEPIASQALAWTGADYALWTNFAREAAGQTLDEDLLHHTYLADSAIVGYRHYELWATSNRLFAERMSMADRASIDEVSFTARKALARGRIALEARAGAGLDWVRELTLARAGVSLWLAPSSRSRLTLSFDFAKESSRALAGERRSGWMTYHVDL